MLQHLALSSYALTCALLKERETRPVWIGRFWIARRSPGSALPKFVFFRRMHPHVSNNTWVMLPGCQQIPLRCCHVARSFVFLGHVDSHTSVQEIQRLRPHLPKPRDGSWRFAQMRIAKLRVTDLLQGLGGPGSPMFTGSGPDIFRGWAPRNADPSMEIRSVHAVKRTVY